MIPQPEPPGTIGKKRIRCARQGSNPPHERGEIGEKKIQGMEPFASISALILRSTSLACADG